MALIRERDSKRLHLKSKLMGESLVGKSFLKSLEYGEPGGSFRRFRCLKSAGKALLI